MTLEELEAGIVRLKKMVADDPWAKGSIEIWKLPSLYAHLYHMGKRAEILSLFAQITPGVSLWK